MIGRLTGRVIDDAVNGDLLVDVGGVGYEVTAPLGTRGRMVADDLGQSTLYIHTHVREDALQLFGFASLDERDAFRIIISISNIGPKLGIALLGAVGVGDLAQMVARGDTGKLTTIPGVGKKTAERLVLELKGKLPLFTATAAAQPRGAASHAAAPRAKNADLVASALVKMGFRPAEADRAVAALSQSDPQTGEKGRDLDATPIGELVREALTALSR